MPGAEENRAFSGTAGSVFLYDTVDATFGAEEPVTLSLRNQKRLLVGKGDYQMLLRLAAELSVRDGSYGGGASGLDLRLPGAASLLYLQAPGFVAGHVGTGSALSLFDDGPGLSDYLKFSSSQHFLSPPVSGAVPRAFGLGFGVGDLLAEFAGLALPFDLFWGFREVYGGLYEGWTDFFGGLRVPFTLAYRNEKWEVLFDYAFSHSAYTGRGSELFTDPGGENETEAGGEDPDMAVGVPPALSDVADSSPAARALAGLLVKESDSWILEETWKPTDLGLHRLSLGISNKYLRLSTALGLGLYAYSLPEGFFRGALELKVPGLLGKARLSFAGELFLSSPGYRGIRGALSSDEAFWKAAVGILGTEGEAVSVGASMNLQRHKKARDWQALLRASFPFGSHFFQGTGKVLVLEEAGGGAGVTLEFGLGGDFLLAKGAKTSLELRSDLLLKAEGLYPWKGRPHLSAEVGLGLYGRFSGFFVSAAGNSWFDLDGGAGIPNPVFSARLEAGLPLGSQASGHYESGEFLTFSLGLNKANWEKMVKNKEKPGFSALRYLVFSFRYERKTRFGP